MLFKLNYAEFKKTQICTCNTPAESHLKDGRGIILGSEVHRRLSTAVFDVSPSLAFLQQLFHTRQVATLTCQVKRCLT